MAPASVLGFGALSGDIDIKVREGVILEFQLQSMMINDLLRRSVA
jgi:hypothetical protein